MTETKTLSIYPHNRRECEASSAATARLVAQDDEHPRLLAVPEVLGSSRTKDWRRRRHRRRERPFRVAGSFRVATHSESQGCVSAYFPRARLGGGPLGAYINASLPVAESSSDAYHTHPQVFAESHDVNNACCKPGRAGGHLDPCARANSVYCVRAVL